MAVRTRQSLHLDMSSLDIAASPPIPGDETVQISLLLAFTGGYLDAYAFAALCVTFGVEAAVGAYGTKIIPDFALGLPVVVLPIVLLHCEIRPNEERL
jgi:uncharacterized membrane protein YoaK (UPF0700 family)